MSFRDATAFGVELISSPLLNSGVEESESLVGVDVETESVAAAVASRRRLMKGLTGGGGGFVYASSSAA
jgi:hypothetical protein